MIRFHPSSVGLLMTDAQSIDISLVPEHLLPVANKFRKTDDDRALLAPYKEMSLSAGAKSYLGSLAKEFIYGYNKVVTTKFMEKGLLLEPEAIEFLNRLRFQRYVKNTERRESEFLTGECDIYVPAEKTIDTKVVWSLETFPALRVDAHDPLYEWQGRAYMKLWDVPKHEVTHILLDTPEELCRYEQRELHIVSHIPPEMRITSVTYYRDAVLEAKLDTKCRIAHAYLMNLVAQIKVEHMEAA